MLILRAASSTMRLVSDQPSDEKPKFDPFKPAEPRLPGVPEKKAPKPAPKPAEAESATAPAPTTEAQPTPAWMAKLPPQLRALPPKALYAGAGGLLLLLVIVLWMAFGSGSESTSGTPQGAASGADVPPVGSPRVAGEPAPEVVTLPAPVATTQEMAKPWSYKKFIVRQAGQRTPAMLLRVPAGTANSGSGYWAFLLQSPFGRCELELMTDTEKLESEYGYRAQNPMVVDPCSRAVFHPLRMGGIGRSTYVRGEVVHGSALRPPVAIDVRVEKGQVIAVRTE
jgi:hypothetical protein